MHILTKFHYPKFKTFFLTSVLRDPHKVRNSLSKVPEKPGGVHAQEAGGHHQKGGEPHQVLARGAIHPMGPFQVQNCFNKELV
jgi:hypothetical protein